MHDLQSLYTEAIAAVASLPAGVACICLPMQGNPLRAINAYLHALSLSAR